MTTETILITGASDGIGAVYADRFAKRGANLILVARRADRLEALAASLRETGVRVEVIAADLAKADDLARVEARLRDDDAITGLINNAGIAGELSFVETAPAYLTGMIDLNILAVTRLSRAIAPRLSARGAGTLVNITSVTALMPDGFTAVYPATAPTSATTSATKSAPTTATGPATTTTPPATSSVPKSAAHPAPSATSPSAASATSASTTSPASPSCFQFRFISSIFENIFWFAKRSLLPLIAATSNATAAPRVHNLIQPLFVHSIWI